MRVSKIALATLCLLILSVNLIVMALPIAHASTVVGPKLITRGKDFADYDMGYNDAQGNRVHQMVIGMPDYVLNPSTGNYVPHLLRQPSPNHVEVQSGLIGWKIGPNDAVITAGAMSKESAAESWNVTDGGQVIGKRFLDQKVVEFAQGVNVTNAYALDNGAILKIIYYIPDGYATQRIVEITGMADVSGVELERHWSINGLADIVSSEGIHAVGSGLQTMPITDNDYNIQFRDANGTVLLTENVQTAIVHEKGIQYQSGHVAFLYGGWIGDGLTLVDDTLTVTGASQDGFLETNAATGTSCPSTSYTKTTTGNTANTRISISTNSDTCRRVFFEWSLANLPTVGLSVSSVVFNFEISAFNNPRNCDYVSMTTLPSSTSNATTLWNAFSTAYTSNNNACTTVATNKSVTLGGNANTDVQNNAGTSIAVGVKTTSETRDAQLHTNVVKTTENTGAVPVPTLVITYTATTVTIPISLPTLAGTSTPLAANFTISGLGCTTTGHNGNPQIQNFVCYASRTITVTAPADTATSSYKFNDATTSKSFTSCASGTCSTQTFTVGRQLKTTLSFSGLDTLQSVPVSKRELGTTTTTIVNNAGSDSYIKFVSGSGKFGTVTNATALNPQQFTISLWIEKESEPNNFSQIFKKGTTGVSGYSVLFDQTATHRPYLNILNTGGTPFDTAATATSFPLFTWRHYAWTFDGSTMTAYENGQQVGTRTITGTYQDSANGNIEIAGLGSTTVNLDDIRLYNRALSAAEISALNTGAWICNGCVGAWLFKEGSGASVADASGNGRTMTLNNSPTWVNKIWSDEGSTVTVSNSITITANQERWYSYNSTAQRSFTAAAATKTYVYHHEFNVLFRVNEEHLGTIFAPMPTATFTSSITLANGTIVPLTFNTQVNDDYLQPAGGSIWIPNGTSSWGSVYWRGLAVISDLDTCSLNDASALNCDEAVYSKHIGSTLGTNHHLRFGVDQATSDAVLNEFNTNTATLNITAYAWPGEHTAKVEFLQSDYVGVQSVFVNGVELPGANYTITADNSVSPPVNILAIDTHFSTDTFVITFTTGAGGGGGGGGGGGSGSSTNPSPIQPTVGSAIGIRIDRIIFQMEPGTTKTQNITIYWQGNTAITIDSITFGTSPEWFTLGRPLPTQFVLEPGETSPVDTIPLTVRLPSSVSGSTLNIPLMVKAHQGLAESSVAGTVEIAVGAPTNNLGYYATAAFFLAFLGGIGYAVVRQGRRR